MKTIAINPTTKTKLIEVAANNKELFQNMWVEEILNTTTDEEKVEAVNNLQHYNAILDNFIKEEDLSKNDLLDLADTFADVSVWYKDDERINAEINWFSSEIINLTKEVN